jgi:hypothetical protein
MWKPSIGAFARRIEAPDIRGKWRRVASGAKERCGGLEEFIKVDAVLPFHHAP